MKPLFSALLIGSLLPGAVVAQTQTTNKSTTGTTVRNVLQGVLNSQTGKTTTTGTTSTNSTGNPGTGISLNSLSSGDIVSGLKEALSLGAQNASKQLSAQNGFFGNALVKVVMPPEAQKVEATLRQFGMGQVVDKAVLSMNRAAEDASAKAVPIFVNAITSMSINDGVNIVRGGKGAATNYLKGKTTAALTETFRPVIQSSLGKTGATALWSNVFTTYNKLPITRTPINADLTAYVTERALNGLFVTIAEEENKIRTNPAARVTDILQKVFGAK